MGFYFSIRNILFLARTNECDLSEDNKEDNQCAGHVIETQSVWTEIQCADMCLRSHLCDRYIFDRQKSGKHDNCELLNTALQPQMSSGGNQHNPSSVCKTMRLKNGKVSRIEPRQLRKGSLKKSQA